MNQDIAAHDYVHADGQARSEWCVVCDRPWSAFVHRTHKTDDQNCSDSGTTNIVYGPPDTASAHPDNGICDICGGQFSDLAGHKSLGVKTHPWLAPRSESGQ